MTIEAPAIERRGRRSSPEEVNAMQFRLDMTRRALDLDPTGSLAAALVERQRGVVRSGRPRIDNAMAEMVDAVASVIEGAGSSGTAVLVSSVDPAPGEASVTEVIERAYSLLGLDGAEMDASVGSTGMMGDRRFSLDDYGVDLTFSFRSGSTFSPVAFPQVSVSVARAKPARLTR